MVSSEEVKELYQILSAAKANEIKLVIAGAKPFQVNLRCPNQSQNLENQIPESFLIAPSLECTLWGFSGCSPSASTHLSSGGYTLR